MTPEKNQLDHQKKNTEPAYQVKDAVQAIVIEESFLTLSLLKFGSQNCETCQETVVCQNSTLQVKNGHENSGDKKRDPNSHFGADALAFDCVSLLSPGDWYKGPNPSWRGM